MPPSFLRRPRLGLSVTDTALRAGIVEWGKNTIAVSTKATVELAAGTVERGLIRDPAKFKDALRRLLKTLPSPHPRRVALCLPPQVLYGCLLPLSAGPRADRSRTIRAAISQVIPEPIDDLVIATTPFSGNSAKMGALCVRRDVLLGYATALKSSGLTVSSLTCVSSIIASLTREVDELTVYADPNGAITVTASLQGWPVDELTTTTAEGEEFADGIRSILATVQGSGRVVHRAIVAGEEALRTTLKTACEATPSLSIGACTPVPERLHEWLPICGNLTATPPWSHQLLAQITLTRSKRLALLLGTLVVLTAAFVVLLSVR